MPACNGLPALPVHAQQLGDRPGLERAAGGGVRGEPVGGLADRAEAVLAQVPDQPDQQVVGGQTGAAGGVDERPDQPRPDRALVVAGVPLGRAAPVPTDEAGGVRGEAARPERVNSASVIRRNAASSGSSGAYGRDQASSWLGRSRSSSWCGAPPSGYAGAGASTTSCSQPAGAGNRVPNAPLARACSSRSAVASRPASSVSSASPASPLIHSALTSTGLPVRGVTGTPYTRASIQVSATSGGPPWVSSPSVGSTRMPYRVPATCASTTACSAGSSSSPRSVSPVSVTCRLTACRNHSVASTVLCSTRPVSAVLASIPSDSVAAYARSSSRPSSARPVQRNSPSYEVMVSRDQAPNHG